MEKTNKIIEMLGREPKFGDQFKTRNGEQAIFWRKGFWGLGYQFITENSREYGYDENGNCERNGYHDYDIVGVWDGE